VPLGEIDAGWLLDAVIAGRRLEVETGPSGAYGEPHVGPAEERRMIDTRPPPARGRTAITVGQPGCRPLLALELRALAEDLAGRVDRDALTLLEEELLAEVVEAAATAALVRVVDAVDDELRPRLEALPLHMRLALAEARRRGQLGID
jgi:hypothetical protein